jgi:hypothetical protein
MKEEHPGPLAPPEIQKIYIPFESSQREYKEGNVQESE